MAKIYALVILALLSLLSPIFEVMATGHVVPFSKFDIAYTFLAITPIYWWFYIDKEQRKFHAGPIQNVGVIFLAIIALPVYFIRSRGWKQGSLSTVKAGCVFATTLFLGWLGEAIAKVFTS